MGDDSGEDPTLVAAGGLEGDVLDAVQEQDGKEGIKASGVIGELCGRNEERVRSGDREVEGALGDVDGSDERVCGHERPDVREKKWAREVNRSSHRDVLTRHRQSERLSGPKPEPVRRIA